MIGRVFTKGLLLSFGMLGWVAAPLAGEQNFQDTVNAVEIPIEHFVRAHDWRVVVHRLAAGPELVGGEQAFRDQLLAFEDAFVELLLSGDTPPGYDGSVVEYHEQRFWAIFSWFHREAQDRPRVVPFPQVIWVLLRASDELLAAGNVESSHRAFAIFMGAAVSRERDTEAMRAAIETRVREPTERSRRALVQMSLGFGPSNWEDSLRRLWADRESLPHVVPHLRALAAQRGW